MDRTFLPERYLPHRFSTGPGLRWWLADGSWEPWAAQVDEVVRTRQIPSCGTVLKRAANRLVVRLPRLGGLATGPASVMVKAFPMRRLRQTLFGRYRCYGPAELTQMITARDRGLPVPVVHGYVERRLGGVMVTSTAVMMEDFIATQSVRDVLENPPSLAERDTALNHAREVLLKLYAAGCNHIDLDGKHILLPTESGADARVIDFMYARFHPTPSLNTFCFMVAYFAESVAGLLPEDCLNEWVCSVVRSTGKEPEGLLRVVAGYRGPRLSRRARLALE